MPRKIALSPLQNHVMRTLEESGEETIGTIKATVREADEELLQREIDALEQLSYVHRSTCNGQPSVVLTPRGRVALKM